MKLLKCDICGKIIKLDDVYGIATISRSSPHYTEQWDFCLMCYDKVSKLLVNMRKAKMCGSADKKGGVHNEKESRKKRAQTSDVSEGSSASEALRPD